MNSRISQNNPENGDVMIRQFNTTYLMIVFCMIMTTVPFFFLSTSAGAVEQDGEKRVLNVATITVQEQQSYLMHRSYLGVVEPKRSSQLGFEIGGKIEVMLVEEGETVKSGQLLARLDVQRLKAARLEAEAQLLEAQATLRLAQATLERTKEAQKRNAVSSQQLDEAAANVAQQKARKSRVEAQIERIDVDLEKADLFAPYDGEIGARFFDEGSVLEAGRPVVAIQETEDVEIRLGIDREYLNRFTPGKQIEANIRGQSIILEIERILPGRQNTTRVVQIIAKPFDTTLPLREGDLVDVIVSQTVEQRGFWLPISALTESSRGLWSCLVAKPLSQSAGGEKQYQLSRRDVEIISLYKDQAYVSGNIDDGEYIVSEGLHRVVPEQHVRIAQRHGSEGFLAQGETK